MAYNTTSNFIDLNVEHPPKVLLKMGEIAAKIGYYNFEWRFVTLVLFNIQPLLVVEAFLKKYNQSVIIMRGKNKNVHRTPLSQFVVIGEQSSEISDTLKWLIKSQYDRAGKFIIICSTKSNKQCDEKKIFQTLSEVFVPNAILLKADDGCPRLYSYRMIQPEKCSNEEPFEINLDDCNNSSCLKSLYQEQLGNFHQCPLIVSTFEQPPFMLLNNLTEDPGGSDGEVLTLLTQILNATLVIKTPSDGAKWGTFDDYNWTGSLGDLYNGRAYASMCSLPLTTDLYGNFQISFTYNTLDIVWTTKYPSLKPAWEKLLLPLKIYTRFTLIFMFLIIILLNSFMKTKTWRNISNIVNAGPVKTNLFFYSWIIFLGIPILRMPSKRTFITIVYIWIWFSFVIRSCYQAALRDSLKHQMYEEKLTNIQHAIKKYFYGGPESLRNYYLDDTEISDNWITLNFSNTFDILDEISNGSSDFVLALNKEVIVEYLKQFNGSRKLQIIPEKIVNSPSVIYFQKHSPLSEPVSRILSIFVEGGFIERIHTQHLDYIKRRLSDYSTHQFEAINLNYFAGTIGFLILGWFLSIIFFVIETYCGRLDGN